MLQKHDETHEKDEKKKVTLSWSLMICDDFCSISDGMTWRTRVLASCDCVSDISGIDAQPAFTWEQVAPTARRFGDLELVKCRAKSS